MARKKVYIVADGMVTSLGAGTWTNVEAVRARQAWHCIPVLWKMRRAMISP